MATIRAAWRLFLVTKLTTIAYLAVVVGTLLTRPWPRRQMRWRNRCFRVGSKALLAAMGAQVESHGVTPKPPFFLVTNHLGYVDVLVLASLVDAAVFVAKADVADWPAIGALCRSMGTLFVDRESRGDLPRVMAAMDRALEGDQGIVLFPEGTSSRGVEVGRFHSSLLEVAARSRQPVSYASLGYVADDGGVPADLSVCWWGDMEFLGHLWQMLKLPGFRATVEFGAERIQDDDRKLLADRLWRAVDRLFKPVTLVTENRS